MQVKTIRIKTLSCSRRLGPYIRVIIVPDGKSWFIQGIDQDYAASGNSIKEAEQNFKDGFMATLAARKEKHPQGGDALLFHFNEPSNKTLNECFK
jgi:hypothetical protein